MPEMKVHRDQNKEIKGNIAAALGAADDQSPENVEGVAEKLEITTGTRAQFLLETVSVGSVEGSIG
jgi:hypothetical protein